MRADLAAHPRQCTLAYYHHPRFSSAGNYLPYTLFPIWKAMYERGVDVVVNGHAHVYERFAPQNPHGNADFARGIRQITVGTGGANHDRFVRVRPNSQLRRNSFGVLEMILRPGSYGWRFHRIPDGIVLDRGSTACH